MRTDRPSLWQLALVRASDKEANRPSPGDNVPGSVDIVRLLPGTRTPILHGSTNERLTAHLCLHGCNQPGQHIALHDGTARVVPFKAGEAIVWDDSFAHELVYEPAARTANGAASASAHAGAGPAAGAQTEGEGTKEVRALEECLQAVSGTREQFASCDSHCPSL